MQSCKEGKHNMCVRFFFLNRDHDPPWWETVWTLITPSSISDLITRANNTDLLTTDYSFCMVQAFGMFLYKWDSDIPHESTYLQAKVVKDMHCGKMKLIIIIRIRGCFSRWYKCVHAFNSCSLEPSTNNS